MPSPAGKTTNVPSGEITGTPANRMPGGGGSAKRASSRVGGAGEGWSRQIARATTPLTTRAVAARAGQRTRRRTGGSATLVDDVHPVPSSVTVTTSGTTDMEFNITGEALGDSVNYLKAEMMIQVEFYGTEPVGIELPVTVDLKVTDTAPGIKGATASAQVKPATLETGLVVNVPPFVNTGDSIRISTETGEYLSRA